MEAVNQMRIHTSDLGKDSNMDRIRDGFKKTDLFWDHSTTDFLSMFQNTVQSNQPFIKDQESFLTKTKQDSFGNFGNNIADNQESGLHSFDQAKAPGNPVNQKTDNPSKTNTDNDRTSNKAPGKNSTKSTDTDNKKVSSRHDEKIILKTISHNKNHGSETVEGLTKNIADLEIKSKNSKELLTKDLKNPFVNNSFRGENSAHFSNSINTSTQKKITKPKLYSGKKIAVNEKGKIITENKSLEKSKTENLKTTNLSRKPVKHNTETRTKDSDVSRETIALPTIEKKLPAVSEPVQPRPGVLEKFNLASNLKSDLDSNFSSNQQHSGFSMHTDKTHIMGKVEDNTFIRQNLQQQIDQLMQKARVIVRENGNASLSTKLNPGELGEISIKLSLIGGKLKGKFTVDNDFVQKELNDKLGKIFANLKSDGYVVDGFQIDVKSETSENSGAGRNFLETSSPEFSGSSQSSGKYFSSPSDLNETSIGRRIYA